MTPMVHLFMLLTDANTLSIMSIKTIGRSIKETVKTQFIMPNNHFCKQSFLSCQGIGYRTGQVISGTELDGLAYSEQENFMETEEEVTEGDNYEIDAL